MYKRLPIDEKIKLIKQVQNGEPIAKVCRRAGVSRTVFYKWQKKYLQAASRIKKKALASKVVYGKKHWKKLPAEIEKQILKIAIKNPSFSAGKISGFVNISAHGVWNILKRNELNNYQKRKAYISQHGSSLIKAPTPVDKLTMIHYFKAGEKITPLCRDFGISRTTFYKWLKRYQSISKDKKRHILHSWRPKGEKHWRFVPKAKKIVLKIVVKYPNLSSKKISQRLPLEKGRSILGSHGVYNLLKKLNLNTYEKRLNYSQAHQPVLKHLTIIAWKDRLKLVWDKFVTGLVHPTH